MCLPDFERFDNIIEENSLIGYRTWRLPMSELVHLLSEHQNYVWTKIIEGPHEVLEANSGIYAYNNYYYNYYNHNNYNYYYNYYHNNYYIYGAINQFGKVAIHKIGQRSEYAKIKTFFTIRESDANGPKKFLDWISKFNSIITELSKRYECKTIHWQDFNEE